MPPAVSQVNWDHSESLLINYHNHPLIIMAQVFYAQTPLWASALAFLLFDEHFSTLSLVCNNPRRTFAIRQEITTATHPPTQAGAFAFTLSLAVAASPDSIFEKFDLFSDAAAPSSPDFWKQRT